MTIKYYPPQHTPDAPSQVAYITGAPISEENYYYNILTRIDSYQPALLVPDWFQTQLVDHVGILKQGPLRQIDRLHL